MLENYKHCLFHDKIILKSQQAFRSDHHDVYTVEINKIALSTNDDKRLQTFDKITTCPHGTNSFKVCESEMLMVMQYQDLVLNDKNRIKEANGIFKTSVTRCMLNRSIRFCKGEMFKIMKYKNFLPNHIKNIKKTDAIFKAINAKCTMNRPILFRENEFRRGVDAK